MTTILSMTMAACSPQCGVRAPGGCASQTSCAHFFWAWHRYQKYSALFAFTHATARCKRRRKTRRGSAFVGMRSIRRKRV